MKRTGLKEDQDFVTMLPFSEEGSEEVDDKDTEMKRTKEIIAIMSKITANSSEVDVTKCCDKILHIFNMSPDIKDQLISHCGVSHIMDMFEAVQTHSYSSMSLHSHISYLQESEPTPASSKLTVSTSSSVADVLRVINKITEGSVKAQEQLIMMGILPGVIRLLSSKALEARIGKDNLIVDQLDQTALEAARFIHLTSSASLLSLQSLIAAGGLLAIVHMISFSTMIPFEFIQEASVEKDHLNSLLPKEAPSIESIASVLTLPKKGFFSNLLSIPPMNTPRVPDSFQPTIQPSSQPSTQPSRQPTTPSSQPSMQPSSQPPSSPPSVSISVKEDLSPRGKISPGGSPPLEKSLSRSNKVFLF
jgi:hypothetical protein